MLFSDKKHLVFNRGEHGDKFLREGGPMFSIIHAHDYEIIRKILQSLSVKPVINQYQPVLMKLKFHE